MVTLKIARMNPESGEGQHWDSFQVPALPTDRLLNLLLYVKGYLDGTLTFRRSCAHGVCGSDAMRINGVNRLACKLLMKDMDLGLDAARRFDVPMPLASDTRNLIQEMIGHGLTEEDFSTLLLMQAKASGVELAPENVKVGDGLS